MTLASAGTASIGVASSSSVGASISRGDLLQRGGVEVVDVDRVLPTMRSVSAGGDTAERVAQRQPRHRRHVGAVLVHERAFEVRVVRAPQQLRVEPVPHGLLDLVRTTRSWRRSTRSAPCTRSAARGTCSSSALFSGSSRLRVVERPQRVELGRRRREPVARRLGDHQLEPGMPLEDAGEDQPPDGPARRERSPTRYCRRATPSSSE